MVCRARDLNPPRGRSPRPPRAYSSWGPQRKPKSRLRSSSGGSAPSDGSTRRCHVTPYYAREILSLTLPLPWGFNAPDTKKIRQGPNHRPCRIFFVPREGFEPPRETHTPLKRTRLPIPPARHGLSRPL